MPQKSRAATGRRIAAGTEKPRARKRLDVKLDRIRAGQYQKGDFIIADAKDADMARGIGAQAPSAARTASRMGVPARGPPGSTASGNSSGRMFSTSC